MTTGGDDFVSARLHFEMDPQGLASLRDVNTELERFRVNADAAARGGESWSQYVKQLAQFQSEATQTARSMVAALERMGGAHERMPTHSTAIPPGYTSPWAGQTTGTGANRQIPTTVPGNPWDHLAANDPRAYLNSRAAWGAPQIPGVQPGQESISQESLDRLAQRLSERDHIQAQEELKRGQEQQQPSSPSRPKRTNVDGSDTPWDEWRNRASNVMGGVRSAMGAMAVGGRGMGLVNMASAGMQGLGRRLAAADDSPGGSVPKFRTSKGASAPSVSQPSPDGEEEEQPEEGGKKGMGGLGGLAKGLGIGGAALGIGATAFGAFQKTGQEIQQYRALGQIRGGGFGEGFGYEMQARMMALNPFITTEQARQVMQSALTNGFTGQEFDTVTHFMANNLKDMNMSVNDSMQLLQAGIHGSNKSVDELTKNLSGNMQALKVMSQFGYTSLPESQRIYAQSFNALTYAGVDPAIAGQQGINARNMWANDNMNKGAGGDINAMSADPKFQILMDAMGGPGGTGLGVDATDPTGILEKYQRTHGAEAGDDAKYRTLQRLTQPFVRGPDPINWMVGQWQAMMARNFGRKMTPRPQAEDEMKKIMAYGTGNDDDPKKQANQHMETKGPSAAAKDLQGLAGGLNSLLGGVPNKLFDLTKGAVGLGGDLIDDMFGTHIGPGGGSSGGNSSGVEVQGPDGKWVPLDPTNKQQLQDLRDHKLQYRTKGGGDSGGGGSDDPGAGDQHPSPGTARGHQSGYRTGGSNQVVGQLQINVQPEKMRQVLGIPTHVPITANEQAANAGYGTATKNDPPPGDSITTRGARPV